MITSKYFKRKLNYLSVQQPQIHFFLPEIANNCEEILRKYHIKRINSATRANSWCCEYEFSDGNDVLIYNFQRKRISAIFQIAIDPVSKYFVLWINAR